MKKTSEPIVFFGSGPVAAESLRLLAQDFTIEAVVTKPRPPHHHGDVPVLTLAKKLGIPIETASSGSELNSLVANRHFSSRVGILVDFGIIVSRQVIDSFPLGIINSHFSVLPQWRGADPITFAILSGQQQTGVSLMLLVEAMDEGPLLAYGEHDITASATTPSLTAELIALSHALLRHTVPAYLAGTLPTAPQSITGRDISYSRRLTKTDGIIDWHKPATVIEHEIRAFTGWPQSRTQFGGLDVILTQSHVVAASGPAGKTTLIDKQPAVYCGQQALVIDKLKPAGKSEMTGQAFLAGYKKLFLT